ncbi:hypothetical protein KSS87_000568 [Heliosperma pusillum]|nr:hypothetical protein KSS87_000568 [Heliosperma pusillum]
MAEAEVGQLNMHELLPSYAPRSVDCFQKLDLISQSSFGQVYMAKEIKTGEIVALKKLRTEDDKEGFPITAVREIKILTKLRHENVIRLKEVVTSEGPVRNHEQAANGKSHSGANLLLDNNGSLKLGDFGLACTLSQEKGNYTNRVIALPYRPPELLLGVTKYGPAVDIWSAGCIFAELFHGKPIMSGRNEPEQLHKIYELCGSPDEIIWPGVSEIPWYNNFKPARPKRRRLREVFRYFDPDALDLLDKMLTLDPCKRISAKDALDADYFRREPLPCDPKCLPKYESSHEYQTKKRRQQQRLNEESARRQGLPHPPPFCPLTPIQNGDQVSQVHQPKPNHSINQPRQPFPPGSSNMVHNPHNDAGLSNRHSSSVNLAGGYNATHTSQSGSYADGPPGFSRRGLTREVNNRNQHYGWQR